MTTKDLIPLVTLTATAMLAPACGSARSQATAGTQTPAAAEAPKPADKRTGYVVAGGLRHYYEIHGQGEPLLLLHGGLGSIDMFGPVLPRLSEKRQVIGVDLRGQDGAPSWAAQMGN